MTAAGRVPGRNYDFRASHRWRTKTKPQILARDRYRCRYCGGPATQPDHVRRVQDGGAWYDPANLVASCRRCNRARANGPARSMATVFQRGLSTSPLVASPHTHRDGRLTLAADYSRGARDAGDR